MFNRTYFIVAIILALITVGLLYFSYSTLLSKSQRSRGQVQLIEAYYAATEIPVRSEIKNEMLQKRLIPLVQYIPGQVTNNKFIVGKVAINSILPGEPLLSKKFADAYSQIGLAYSIPKGKRAVSIKVDELSSFANLVKPGDKVDVVLVYTPSGGKAQKSDTILQNTEIMAIDQLIKGDSTAPGVIEEIKKQVAKKKVDGHIVTFALTPADAQRILLAQSQGQLSLVLRAFNDETISTGDSIDFEAIETTPQGGAFAMSIPKGKRAVAVSFFGSSQAIAMLIQPGDKVDVLYTTLYQPEYGTVVRRTITLLHSKPVYAVNSNITAATESGSPQTAEQWINQSAQSNSVIPASTKSDGSQIGSSFTLTFALDAYEAEKVVLAESQGQLSLALRSSGDDKNTFTGGISAGTLINAGGANGTLNGNNNSGVRIFKGITQ